MNRGSVLEPRQAGVCMHITSLPGPYGIGEIGAAAFDFVDAMSRMDLGTWQILPLGPTAYGNSPYQPLSTFAGNEMLIDIGDLVRRGLLTPSEVQPLEALPRNTVDYGSLIPVKTALLAKAAERFPRMASSQCASEFDAFVEATDVDWLHEYALYRVLKDQHDQRAWPDWRPEYKHHDDDALKRLESASAQQIECIKIQQFLFASQWQRLRRYASEQSVSLFGDMPICIALDSADAWASPEFLRIDRDGVPDCVAGVPPDYFSEDGQLWGNPLYDWPAHDETGYRWWISRLRSTTELVDLVRIDHFRGFEAYWAIPGDATDARVGEWEPGPREAIFDAFKDAFGALPIVAEDLGVITPPVDELRMRYNIPGMIVLQFEAVDPGFNWDSVVENSVVYTGTHDNDTTVGWFNGSDEARLSAEELQAHQDAILRFTDGSPSTIAIDLIRTALNSRALLAIAPMQDFLELGSDARVNTPGTSENNWRWRFRQEQLTDERCDLVAGIVAESGRSMRRAHAVEG